MNSTKQTNGQPVTNDKTVTAHAIAARLVASRDKPVTPSTDPLDTEHSVLSTPGNEITLTAQSLLSLGNVVLRANSVTLIVESLNISPAINLAPNINVNPVINVAAPELPAPQVVNEITVSAAIPIIKQVNVTLSKPKPELDEDGQLLTPKPIKKVVTIEGPGGEYTGTITTEDK